jgi:phytoene dehydrogenase-like protein
LAASEEFHPGHRSPGLLHDTSGVRHELLESLNLAGHGLELEPDPPSVFSPYGEGGGFEVHHDARKGASVISLFSRNDSDRYIEYRTFIDRVRGFVNGMFDDAPPDIGSLDVRTMWPLIPKGIGLRRLGKHDMVELFRIIPMSVADWLDEWFETDLLKAALVAPALRGSFVGPRSPGSAFGLLLWECRKGPVVKGGPGALVNALEAAAKANGVEIRVGAKATAIRVGSGQVEGVTLEGGEAVDAAVVASTCDPKTTFLELLPPSAITEVFEHRIRVYRTIGTTAKVDIALERRPKLTAQNQTIGTWMRTGHNLTEFEKAFDAVKYRQCSESPVLDVYVPPGEPNDGCALSVLVQYVPYDLKEGWGDAQKAALGSWVIEELSEILPELKEEMVSHRVLSPLDIETQFGTTGGHVYHGDHNIDQLFVRPSLECARYGSPVRGLYLCGSGSFPGGGITCAPGALGARTILEGV